MHTYKYRSICVACNLKFSRTHFLGVLFSNFTNLSGVCGEICVCVDTLKCFDTCIGKLSCGQMNIIYVETLSADKCIDLQYLIEVLYVKTEKIYACSKIRRLS